MGFYEDMKKSLTEAIELKEEKNFLTQRENMPAKTLYYEERKEKKD